MGGEYGFDVGKEVGDALRRIVFETPLETYTTKYNR